MRPAFRLPALVPAISLLAACAGAPTPLATKPPSVGDGDEQQATCKVAKDPLNPLVVEWPGTSKVALDSASQKGVVVVSYVGCVLKVLTSCQAGGTYELKSVTAVRDKVSIENETDLYARLPLGVASLKAELATSGRLDLEYVAVGQRETAKPPVSVSGECAGATHYVRSIMVGAYSLDAVGTAKVSGAVELAGKGGGDEHKEGVRRLRGSGDVGSCASGAASGKSDCGAVLQLGLAPLMVSGGAVTAAGFGAGLGALSVVPTVQALQTLSGGQSLAAADVDLLDALQAAKRAEKGDGSPESKAAAWDGLARYAGKANPYKELAEKRRDDWKRVGEAETRRREQTAQVCAQHAKDEAKLAELLALDDDVVPAKQKEGYKREFAEVYAHYQSALAECAADRAEEARAQAVLADAKKIFRAADLLWTLQPAEETLPDAEVYCRGLPLAGGNWRLPTKTELEALYTKRSARAASIPGMTGGVYWSSTRIDGDPSAAWTVNFASGYATRADVALKWRVRCVR